MYKLESTLKLFFITLFLFPFSSFSETVHPTIIACNQALDNQQYEKAIEYAQRAIKESTQATQGMLCRGRALLAQGKTDEAKSQFLAAEKSATSAYDQAVSYLLLGNLNKAQGQYQQAIENYSRSLKAAQQDNHRNFTRISHNLLGETYVLLQQYPQAMQAYEAGAKLALNDNERADSYERIATTYRAEQMFDKAIEYQLKGTMMQKKAGTPDQYAEASLMLGQLFKENKDYSSAERTYARLIEFCKENGGDYYEAKTLIYLAEAKYAQGDSVIAKQYLAEAEELAKKVQATDLTDLIKTAQKK